MTPWHALDLDALPLPARDLSGRQETLEGIAVRGQAGDRQGRDTGRRAGHRHDPQLCLACRSNQDKARITDQRRPGVTDDGD